MPGLALDCSITLPWYLEDEKTAFTESLLAQAGKARMVVPALWRLEFVSAMLIAARRARISNAWRDTAIAQAAALPLETDEHLVGIDEIRALALAHGLTPYDAVYFELAQRRGLTLATLDEDLVRAARSAKLALTTDLSLYPEPVPPKPKKPKA
jgi:predicted nucleic acid-binding protein